MKLLLKSLREAKKELSRVAKAMPDKDAYAIPYCILNEMFEAIETGMKEIEPAVKQAKYEAKQNKSDLENRAKGWCKIK